MGAKIFQKSVRQLKFHYQNHNIKQTPHSGATLKNVVTWDLHTLENIIRLEIYNM